MYEIEKYVNTNIGGTALMLDILTNAKHNVKRVIVAESRASMEKANTIATIGKRCVSGRTLGREYVQRRI